MPHILSIPISESLPPLWFEKTTYSKQNIYKIEDNKLPPVNYDSHTFFPHSLTHIEAESHVVKNGKTIDDFFLNPSSLYGTALVIKLKGTNYKVVDEAKGIYHWEVSRRELEEGITRVAFAGGGGKVPHKILLTTEFCPLNEYGYHDPDYVLTLSQKAADYLVAMEGFDLYGTSWKSSDFKPGSSERPIHKTLFKKAAILECLVLDKVPEGIYFLTAFPLPIVGASESPVCPVLFSREELVF